MVVVFASTLQVIRKRGSHIKIELHKNNFFKQNNNYFFNNYLISSISEYQFLPASPELYSNIKFVILLLFQWMFHLFLQSSADTTGPHTLLRWPQVSGLETSAINIRWCSGAAVKFSPKTDKVLNTPTHSPFAKFSRPTECTGPQASKTMQSEPAAAQQSKGPGARDESRYRGKYAKLSASCFWACGSIRLCSKVASSWRLFN